MRSTQGTLTANSSYTINFTGSTLAITPGRTGGRGQPPDQGLRHRRSQPDRHRDRICRHHGRRGDDRRHGRDSGLGPACADTRRDGIRRPLCDHPGHARGEQLQDRLHRQHAGHHSGDALDRSPSPRPRSSARRDPTLAYTTSGFQFSDTAATVLTGIARRGRPARRSRAVPT